MKAITETLERRAHRLLWIGAPGICRFCGCSELDACVVDDVVGFGACYWTDRAQRVCSVCAPAAKAEGQLLRALRRGGWALTPAVVRALHLGFVVGWFDVSPRSAYGRNPFAQPTPVRGWAAGQRAGAEARRVHVRLFGPVTNAPRRPVLQ